MRDLSKAKAPQGLEREEKWTAFIVWDYSYCKVLFDLVVKQISQ